ncbi:MAG: hypothetical protein ACJA0E_000811 [Bermanella sp.]|jgi:hypothetical protein
MCLNLLACIDISQLQHSGNKWGCHWALHPPIALLKKLMIYHFNVRMRICHS